MRAALIRGPQLLSTHPYRFFTAENAEGAEEKTNCIRPVMDGDSR
jgi:hypothetical protein